MVEEFNDSALYVLKAEVNAYLQVLHDEIQGVDPKFPIREAKSLQILIESSYTKKTPIAVSIGEKKVAPVPGRKLQPLKNP